MEIKLIVIRTNALEALVGFYALLGMRFEHHRHGNSPYHYSANIGATVFEIYPLAKGQVEPDRHLRLGFSLTDFDGVVAELVHKGVHFHLAPAPSDFGWMAVVEDPDGRKVELYKI